MRAPNLIPLLDVMIVILLFLMLVADFGPREREPLDLPDAFSIRDCTKGERGTPLTINVHHRDDRACSPYAQGEPCGIDEHWQITINGRECTNPTYLRTVLVQEAPRGDLGGYFPRNRRIILRADAVAPTGMAQRAMNACARLGFQHVHVAAARPVSH